jgi:signal transduction histidine kinase
MLMLARLGEHQFVPEDIDWKQLFDQQLRSLEDLIEKRALRVMLENRVPCAIRLHPVLADLLVANLLRNAVQHNEQGGWIDVLIERQGFQVENTGPLLQMDPNQLFDRFAKGDPSSTSTGLGLSIVKEIADTNGLRVVYEQTNSTHLVSVIVDPNKVRTGSPILFEA